MNLIADDGTPKDFTFDGSYFMDSTGGHHYNDIVVQLVEVRVIQKFGMSLAPVQMNPEIKILKTRA